jgi:hypothetical protein
MFGACMKRNSDSTSKAYTSACSYIAFAHTMAIWSPCSLVLRSFRSSQPILFWSDFLSTLAAVEFAMVRVERASSSESDLVTHSASF